MSATFIVMALKHAVGTKLRNSLVDFPPAPIPGFLSFVKGAWDVHGARAFHTTTGESVCWQ